MLRVAQSITSSMQEASSQPLSTSEHGSKSQNRNRLALISIGIGHTSQSLWLSDIVSVKKLKIIKIFKNCSDKAF